MNILFVVCFFVVIHFIADFLLQPHWMAQLKSKDLSILALHCGSHFGWFLFGGVIVTIAAPTPDGYRDAMLVALFIAITHGIIDWNIWRGYKRYAERKFVETQPKGDPSKYPFWEDHWFWVTLGADQMLHVLCILTALLLKDFI